MNNTKKLTLSAFFLALGLVMPFLTMQIPEIGSMLLPMHIPVLICGFICNWKYGLTIGFFTPLLRSVLWGMPPFFTALTMAFELAAYGFLTGFLYRLLHRKKLAIYITLISSMLIGRLVWGIASLVIYTLMGNAFTWELFIGGAILQAVPGIILQLVLIPPVIILLQKSELFHLK